MKICKDGRIWGQNNKEAANHLGILTGRKGYTGRGVKRNNNPMYRKCHSIESRIKMGETNRGSKHWNWRGGIDSMADIIRGRIEYRLWREAVYARDNWTCQKCGKRGGRLQPHHIKSFAQYPELRFAIDNGQTLCLECHKLTDNYKRGVKLKMTIQEKTREEIARSSIKLLDSVFNKKTSFTYSPMSFFSAQHYKGHILIEGDENALHPQIIAHEYAHRTMKRRAGKDPHTKTYFAHYKLVCFHLGIEPIYLSKEACKKSLGEIGAVD